MQCLGIRIKKQYIFLTCLEKLWQHWTHIPT